MPYTNAQLDQLSQAELLALLRREFDIYNLFDANDPKASIISFFLAQQEYLQAKPKLVPYQDMQRKFDYQGALVDTTYPTNFVDKPSAAISS